MVSHKPFIHLESEELKDKVKELLERLGGPDGEEARRAARVLEPLDEVYLERWLIARKGDVAHAERDLRKHVAWREAHTPGGRLHPDCIETELRANKVFMMGGTKTGHAVCILLTCRHDASTRDLEEVKRLIVYSLDVGRAMCDPKKNPLRKCMGIIDLSNLAFRNLDSSGLLQVFKILQNHFPETLDKMWFVNAPVIFQGVWKVVSPFVDPVTKAKVAFVQTKEVVEALSEIADPSVIPREYGGQADLVPLEEWGFKLFGERLGDGKGTDLVVKEMNTDDL